MSETQSAPEGEALPISSERLEELRTGRWILVLLGVLMLLVLVGGLVRITGSGLSIPHWPIIYYGEHDTNPSLLPPLTEERWEFAREAYHEAEGVTSAADGMWRSEGQFKWDFWREYTHRAIAAVFGVLFLYVAFRILRRDHLRRQVGPLLGISVAVLLGQIVLGGTVVKTHTPAFTVSFHLGTAFIFVAMILWMGLKLYRPKDERVPEEAPAATKWVWITAAACFLQIFTGGLMAKTAAAKHDQLTTWPLLGERLIPANVLWDTTYEHPIANFTENVFLINWLHRWFAFAVAGFVIYLIVRLIRQPLTNAGRLTLRALAFILVFQMTLGVFTLIYQVPVSLGLAHLVTGLVLFLLLIALAFEVRSNEAIALLEQERLESERALGIEAA